MTNPNGFDARTRFVYHCGSCGSFRVQISAWIDANRGTDAGGDGPTDDTYCPSCMDMRSLRYAKMHDGKWFDWNHEPAASLREAVRRNIR